MTAEEAIDILDRCVIGDCEICTKNKKHGGHCKGSDYAFSAIAEAQKALEKQMPKKPKETKCALMCARCGHKIDVFSESPQEIPYLQAAKVLREVSDAPAADVAPVVHGQCGGEKKGG